MKKNTRRPGLTNSANLPVRADSGRETPTGSPDGRPVWMAVGGKHETGGGNTVQKWASHNFKMHRHPHETFTRTDLDDHRHACLVRHASRPGAFAKDLWRAGGGEDSGDAGSRRRRSLVATPTKVSGWIRSLASRSRTANRGSWSTQGLKRSQRCARALRRAACVRKMRGGFLVISSPLPLRLRIHAVGIGLVSQLGPDTLPVIGAQLLSGNQSLGGLLNSPAINRAGLSASVAVLPLPDLHIRLDTNSNCQLPHGQRTRALQIVIEFHEAGAYSKC